MGASPVWAATPKTGSVLISAADTTRSGLGSGLESVYTAGSNGGVVDAIYIQSADAVGTPISAGMIRLFIDGGGAVRLFKEVPVTAQPAGATGEVAGWSALLTAGNGLPPEGLRLQAGYILKASTHEGEPFVVIAQAGDF